MDVPGGEPPAHGCAYVAELPREAFDPDFLRGPCHVALAFFGEMQEVIRGGFQTRSTLARAIQLLERKCADGLHHVEPRLAPAGRRRNPQQTLINERCEDVECLAGTSYVQRLGRF